MAAIFGKMPGDRCRSGKEWMSGLFEEKNKAVSQRKKLLKSLKCGPIGDNISSGDHHLASRISWRATFEHFLL
jgi:hypothetical protein